MFNKIKYPIEYFIIVFLLIAYALPWIEWNNMIVSGFDLPFLYKKITKVSNTILLFSKKDFLYTAFYIYTIPILALLSGFYFFKDKKKVGVVLLLISVVDGLFVSLYMYYYLYDSSIFSLKNGGLGILLLLLISLFCMCYLILKRHLKRRKIR